MTALRDGLRLPGRVLRLATLFSLDSFGGGFVVQSLLALWLFRRFDLSVQTAGTVFFVAGLLSATSQLVASRLAAHIGLINTAFNLVNARGPAQQRSERVAPTARDGGSAASAGRNLRPKL